MTAIIPIHLPLVNVFLLRARQGWVLIDSGAPGDHSAILSAIARHGIAPNAISLILLTHGHVDHFGGAAALRAATGAAVAIHKADLPFLRAGRNPELAPTGFEGRLFRPFLPWSAPPLEPDLAFDDDFAPADYGLAAELIHTPGHSPGSVSLLLETGALIAGDLLRGGFLGGRLWSGRPNPPFYLDNPIVHAKSLKRALAIPTHTIFVGHGGPIATEAARRLLPSLPSGQPT
jgi:glyoxylase-like metal-dependent hydrolase (beta-lactamase superfamily II)